MDVGEHPYADFLHKVDKPAQYIGGEHGQKRKDWDAVACRMCLAFPDLYEIGMSHLGYKILYGILNGHEKLLAERAYAPWSDMEEQLREHGEFVRSLESQRPLKDFDVVGFSLQYELTYTNILTMLELGGIPRWSKDRTDTDPLIVCGGPVATHSEPMAPFIDVFLIGDGEEKTAELMLSWAALRDAGVPRQERLKAIANLGGFYVPSLYPVRKNDEGVYCVEPSEVAPDAPYPVQRAFVTDLNKFPFPSDGPVSATETIFDRVSVEVARGCTEGCRFCQAGMIYRPVRERSPESILDSLLTAVRDGGYDEASLTSLSTADYSAIQPLVRRVMEELEGEKVNVTVSSLRAYGLSEVVLDDMKTQRAGGLTFAPEAGTQRMRDVINKNVTEEQLLETSRRVFSRSWTKMKLYFILGLPTETDEDVLGIIETGHRAHQVGRRAHPTKNANVTVSVSTHVPKPHTPFQWCAMDQYEEVVRKQALLKDAAKKTRVKLRMHDSKGSWLEGVLARGDRRLAQVISDAFDRGARFDSWDERLNLDAWNEAFEKNEINTELFLGTIPVNARLPWDHIDVGLEDGFLAKEYRKALKNRLSPPCGKVAGTFVHHTNLNDANEDARKLVCYDCGVACDMQQMRGDRLVKLRTLNAEQAPEEVPVEPPTEEELLAIKRRDPPKREDQGPLVRVRVAFTKTSGMAYRSHLDLVRLFPRMFRRANLPMYYSIGFHQKPMMVFGPALSLGVASLAEYVDLKLRKDLISDERLARVADDLQGVTMEGVTILGARVLGPRDPALNRVIDQATYVVGVPRKVFPDLGVESDAQVASRVATALEGELTFVRRRKKKKDKVVDVKKTLRSVTVGEGADVLTRAGLVGDLLPIRLVIDLDPSGTVKASEAIQLLLKTEEDIGYRIVREAIVRAETGATPLDLEAHRKPPRATPRQSASEPNG